MPNPAATIAFYADALTNLRNQVNTSIGQLNANNQIHAKAVMQDIKTDLDKHITVLADGQAWLADPVTS